MNFQSIFKRETKLIVYVVSALTIVLIGSTYALFFKVKENSNNQVVQAGALIMEYPKSGELVVAEGDAKDNNCLYPTDDEDGNTNGCSYTFTMTNSGSLPVEYTLYLYNDITELPEGGKLLEIKNIKHTLRKRLVKEGEEATLVNNAASLDSLKQDTEKGTILEKEVINVGESIEFSLRVWIDEDAPNGDDPNSIVGNYVRLKINASSTVYEEPNYVTEILKKLVSEDNNGVCPASGIVPVTHTDATISNVPEYETLGLDYTRVQANLKMTEYRYCGENPNNYVTFNGETAGWRIIGLVNTPEGQRIKLIRATPLEPLMAWNKKETSNNDWSVSELQKVLNKGGAYYERQNGNCPAGENGETIECNFRDVGLTGEAKEMIDTITWNLGGSAPSLYGVTLTRLMYDGERGIKVYTDQERPLLWKGEIGLLYPSDYGYATGGGSNYNRDFCVNKHLYYWRYQQYQNDCAYTDWLINRDFSQWTITPGSDSSTSSHVLDKYGEVLLNYSAASYYQHGVSPVLYLKPNVEFASKDSVGSPENPYELVLNE